MNKIKSLRKTYEPRRSGLPIHNSVRLNEIGYFGRNYELEDRTFEARIVLPRKIESWLVPFESSVGLWGKGELGEKCAYFQGHYESENRSFADRKILHRNVEIGRVYAKLTKG
jgi:hypothetical protein